MLHFENSRKCLSNAHRIKSITVFSAGKKIKRIRSKKVARQEIFTLKINHYIHCAFCWYFCNPSFAGKTSCRSWINTQSSTTRDSIFQHQAIELHYSWLISNNAIEKLIKKLFTVRRLHKKPVHQNTIVRYIINLWVSIGSKLVFTSH